MSTDTIEKPTSARHIWTSEETKSLLSFYRDRKDEFSHPRRKKYAYQNLVEDLMSSGVMTEPVTAIMVENKIKSVLRAYKASEGNAGKTGSGSHIAPYADLVEDIFSTKACKRSAMVHVGSIGLSPLINDVKGKTSEITDESPALSISNEVPGTSTPVCRPNKRNRTTSNDKILEMLQKNAEEKKARWEERKRIKELELKEKRDWREMVLEKLSKIN